MEFLSEFSFGYLTGHWTWITQVFVVIFLSLILNFTQGRFLRWVHAKLVAGGNRWADSIVEALKNPLTLLIWILGLTFAGDIIYAATETPIFGAADVVRNVGVIAAIAWFLTRLIRNGEKVIIKKAGINNQRVDQHTAEAVSKLLRLAVLITASLVILQTLGFSISGVLAFGGLGGIVIGLAARDFVSNFFGGLTIYLDRPFHVGDWIRSPDRNIEGTVEEIGWRQTRIRTFDKRPLYVPNSIFTTIALENPSRMTHRRIYENIGIRYADINVMAKITADVKAMLREHPEIAADQTMIVNFNAFSESSIDFMLYTFTKTTDWVKYHEVKQDVLLKVADIIAKHGAEIAFPTRTLHLEGQEPQYAGLPNKADETLLGSQAPRPR
ncbi:MAG TPA: mechanosensitive ion channel family protein [Halothiobacillus sp.]|mgnify:CR=1 FL=1|nr:mechanosensitive ion channel family protein [Halothiobacillus sp.]